MAIIGANLFIYRIKFDVVIFSRNYNFDVAIVVVAKAPRISFSVVDVVNRAFHNRTVKRNVSH